MQFTGATFQSKVHFENRTSFDVQKQKITHDSLYSEMAIYYHNIIAALILTHFGKNKMAATITILYSHHVVII
jgi:hypothetical protein